MSLSAASAGDESFNGVTVSKMVDEERVIASFFINHLYSLRFVVLHVALVAINCALSPQTVGEYFRVVERPFEDVVPLGFVAFVSNTFLNDFAFFIAERRDADDESAGFGLLLLALDVVLPPFRVKLNEGGVIGSGLR